MSKFLLGIECDDPPQEVMDTIRRWHGAVDAPGPARVWNATNLWARVKELEEELAKSRDNVRRLEAQLADTQEEIDPLTT